MSFAGLYNEFAQEHPEPCACGLRRPAAFRCCVGGTGLGLIDVSIRRYPANFVRAPASSSKIFPLSRKNSSLLDSPASERHT